MNKFYDQIASEYDQLVQQDVESKSFPYAAYNDLQDVIINYISGNKHISKAKVLDVGIGTGSLYERILPDKLDLTGIDFSKKMLEIAQLRLTNAKLIHHDITKGLPAAIKEETYDFIIINYLFKHFDLETLINYIHHLTKYLNSFGRIFIGDVLFLDETRRKIFLSNHPEDLNPNYYFHAYSDIVHHIDDNLALSFMEINEYSGILIIEKYHESALHYKETLVKYKSNTVKCKSNQSQKHRE